MDAYIGEIRLLPYVFAPQGWLACDGSIYSARNYQALYSVIGNYFGGSVSQSTFAVPDLRSRTMVGSGNDPTDAFDPPYATSGGYEQVPLTTSTVPPHTHTLTGANVKAALRVASPTGNYVGPLSTNVAVANVVINNQAFTVASDGGYPPQPVLMNAATVSPFVGGTAGHENRQPYLAMQFCINWDGWFPVRP
jgi:microcystin-dependent protein